MNIYYMILTDILHSIFFLFKNTIINPNGYKKDMQLPEIPSTGQRVFTKLGCMTSAADSWTGRIFRKPVEWLLRQSCALTDATEPRSWWDSLVSWKSGLPDSDASGCVWSSCGDGGEGTGSGLLSEALEISWERSRLCLLPILPWPSVRGRGYNGKWMKTKPFHWNFYGRIRLPCFVLSITVTPGGQKGDGESDPFSC